MKYKNYAQTGWKLYFTIFSMILLSVSPTHGQNNLHKELVTTKGYIIPFELTDFNNIKVKVVINEKDSLYLKFDTGGNGIFLKHDAIKNRTSLLDNDKEKTPTENYVRLKAPASIRIGKMKWDSLTIFPVTHSGQGTDGIFGWNLFESKIVEINYDNSQLVIYDKLPSTLGYTKSPMQIIKGVPSIQGELIVDGKKYKGRCMFDTGYQRALLLDTLYCYEQKFPKNLKVIKETKLLNAAGDEFITRVVNLPFLKIGGQLAKEVPIQLISTGNPAGFKTHILGNELLKRYNVMLDFKNGMIYLKENHLIDVAYVDMK